MAKKKKETPEESGRIKKDKKAIYLPCKLSTEEIIEKGGALAAIVKAVSAENVNLEAEKESFKEIKKGIEDSIISYKVRQSELSEAISTGEEKRDVDCEVVFDYEKERVTVRRLDTDTVFEDREMNDLERQMQLDFEEANPKPTSAMVPCNDCNGTGIDSNNCRCEVCRGASEIEVSVTEPEESKGAENE